MIQAKSLSRRERRKLISEMERESNRWPARLVELLPIDWPSTAKDVATRMGSGPVKVFRSRSLLVQVYDDGGQIRLSVTATVPRIDGEWPELNWEDLQQAKQECGFGSSWAVELYPPDIDVVNVANMRHLWLIPEPKFGWKR